MPTCPKCGAAVEEGARFCPRDGTVIVDEPITEVELRRTTLKGPVVVPPTEPLARRVVPVPPAPPPPAAPSAAPVAPVALSASTGAAARPAPGGLPALDQPSGPTQQLDVVIPAALNGDLVGKVIDNRYHIIDRLSAGSVGVVYRGEHIGIRRPIAVKVLHEVHRERDDYLVRFEREALAASKMNHPACVSVLDFGTFEGRPYMVMEFVEGRPLSEVLQEGPLPLADAVLLTRLILGALRHSHRLGVIHRDIKPANIMLCDPGRTGAQLKVLDFGLAKSLDLDDRAGQRVTLAGTICGTPGYLSPEQATGLPLDGRSDLYSVGAVLFTLVCGRRPFVYGELAAEIRAHVCETPPRVRTLRPEASAELEAVIATALEKDPADRFQNADDFIGALATVPEATGANLANAPGQPLSTTRGAPPAAAPPPASAPDLHAAATVLHAAPTVLLDGGNARDGAEPAWATRAEGAAPLGAGAPSQSLPAIPTTGRGARLAALAAIVVVIVAGIVLWYFAR